jgi:hypothetical protein
VLSKSSAEMKNVNLRFLNAGGPQTLLELAHNYFIESYQTLISVDIFGSEKIDLRSDATYIAFSAICFFNLHDMESSSEIILEFILSEYYPLVFNFLSSRVD